MGGRRSREKERKESGRRASENTLFGRSFSDKKKENYLVRGHQKANEEKTDEKAGGGSTKISKLREKGKKRAVFFSEKTTRFDGHGKQGGTNKKEEKEGSKGGQKRSGGQKGTVGIQGLRRR